MIQDLIHALIKKFGSEINDTGLWWLVFGIVGQLAFTGRFLYQWIISEKVKKSVVPVGFWYMSIVGAAILLVYFIRRGDPVGTLGQTIGSVVYVRNLMLIYKEKRRARIAPA